MDAVRGRIRRGTLESERESGTVYVLVDRTETDRPGPSTTSRRPSDDQSELVEALRDQVNYLREQLEEERRVRTEERRRQDTIIAQLMQRIPEIEAPREPSGATEPRESPERPGPTETPTKRGGGPQTASEEPERAEPLSSTPGPQERVTRPWWRRIIGG